MEKQKTTIMPSNGATTVTKPTYFKSFEEKLHTALLSIVTAAVVGCVGFLWNVNTVLTRLQERDTENIRSKEEMIIKINTMQLDIRDIRERLIRVESKTNKQ